MPLFKPRWWRSLPAHLRPGPSATGELDAVRRRYKIQHQQFLLHLAGHPATTRLVLRQTYQQALVSGQTEHGAKCIMVMSRVNPATPDDPFGLKRRGLIRLVETGRIDEVDRLLSEVVNRFGSIEELIDATVREENQVVVMTSAHLRGAAQQISRILEQDFA